MTYDISDKEKLYANKALHAFEYLLSAIESFNTHLDLLLIPFKENQDITPEQIWKYRANFRDFRDLAEKNLDKIKKISLRCMKIINYFISDTQIEKIMRSFNSCIEDVILQFDRFMKLFNNMQAQDFKDNIVKAIDGIKKETAQLKQIIEERIQDRLERDILNKSWVNNEGDVSMYLAKKDPLEMRLFKKRNEHSEGLEHGHEKPDEDNKHHEKNQK